MLNAIGIGIPFRRPVGGGNNYSPYLNAVLSAAKADGNTLPSEKVLTALDKVAIWVNESNLFDYFHLYRTDGDSDFATWNLVNPAKHRALKINSPTFVPLGNPNPGFKGNGTTSYLHTQYNPAVDGVKLSQDDGHFAVYVQEQDGGSIGYGGVNGTTSSTRIQPGPLDSTQGGRMAFGNTGFANGPGANVRTYNEDLFITSRATSTHNQRWYGSLEIGTGLVSSASIEKTNASLGILASLTNAGAVSQIVSDTVMCSCAGKFMTNGTGADSESKDLLCLLFNYIRETSSHTVNEGLKHVFRLNENGTLNNNITSNRLDCLTGKYLNHGTSNNLVTQQLGKRSRAYTNDAGDRYLIDNSENLVDLLEDSFTISCWVMFTAFGSANRVICSKWNGDEAGSFILGVKGNSADHPKRIYANIGTDGTSEGVLEIEWPVETDTDIWNFVVFSFNKNTNTISLSVDTDTPQTLATPIFKSNSKFVLGGRPDINMSIPGRIDEMYIHNKVLSQTEIDYLYNSGTGRFFPFE